MKPFMSLPELALVKIFLYLSGQSLHRCRQVSKTWNDFILKNIWNSKFSRNQLEDRLDNNWGHGSGDVKCTLSTKMMDNLALGSCVVVAAASEDYVALEPGPTMTGYRDVEDQKLAVFNMKTEELWKIDLFDLIGTGDENMEVLINNNILAVTSADVSTNVKIWSIGTRKVVFQEDTNKFIHKLVLQSFSSVSWVALVRENELELLKFDGDALGFRHGCPYNFGCISFSNFVFPHILLGEFLKVRDGWGNYSILVWKVDDENEKIVNHKYLPDSSSFTHENIFIYDAIYVSSSFVISTCNSQERPCNDGWTFVENCIIKIVNEDGELIRELEIVDYDSPPVSTKLQINGNRLLVELIRECVIFKLDLKDLLSGEENEKVSFKKLNQLKQESDLYYKTVINKTSISRVHVPYNNDMKEMEIKRLDFWATD